MTDPSNVWPWIAVTTSGAFLALASWSLRDVLRGVRDGVEKLGSRLDAIERRLDRLEAKK